MILNAKEFKKLDTTEKRRIINENEDSLFYCCFDDEIKDFLKYENVTIFKEVEESTNINYVEHYEYIAMIKSEEMKN